MSWNRIGDSSPLNVVLDADAVSGEPVFVDRFKGVATIDGDSGDSIPIITQGRVRVKKDEAVAFAFGEPVFCTGGTGTDVDDTVADATYFGCCTVAALAADAYVEVSLDEGYISKETDVDT